MRRPQDPRHGRRLPQDVQRSWLSKSSVLAAFGTDAGGADASQLATEMDAALNAIQAPRAGNANDAGAADIAEALLRNALLDAVNIVAARTALMANGVLPQSAVDQTEAVLTRFQERYRRSPAAENGEVSGTDTVASAQRQTWFPAYLACLLDPRWVIPGFSPGLRHPRP